MLRVVAGSAIGAMGGGGVGLATKKKKPKSVGAADPNASQDDQPPADPAQAPPLDTAPKLTPHAPAARYEVFGVPTHYMTTSNELYTTMDRFYNLLQFAEEQRSFERVITHLDHLLGMEIMLATRVPVARNAIPSLAHRVVRGATKTLDAIVQFSQEKRPSATKLATLTSIRTELVEALDEIVTSMHRTLAAEPMVNNVSRGGSQK